jgi:translation initiation factor SUI1
MTGRPLLLSKGLLLLMIKNLMTLFKKKFACNVTVIEYLKYGEVIQLQGDQHKNICQFLVETRLAKVVNQRIWV